MSNIINSWWMYLLGILVVLVVLAGSIFFIYRSYKDAKAINMDTSILKKTIFNSAMFTILPSISILLGVISLSGTLGIPLPWIRLTVIGALHYEGAAVKAAYAEEALQALTPQMFVTIAFVMTLGILSGPLYCLFGFKSYDKKVLSKVKVNSSNNDEEKTDTSNKPKKSFGNVLFDAVFIAMISSFLAVDIAEITDKNSSWSKPYIPTIVIVVTFASMALFDLLEKKLKLKWLNSFSLGLSMIIGMATAAILG